jgi:hypothetical protein
MLGEYMEVDFLLKHSLNIALNLNYFERDTVALKKLKQQKKFETTRHGESLVPFPTAAETKAEKAVIRLPPVSALFSVSAPRLSVSAPPSDIALSIGITM